MGVRIPTLEELEYRIRRDIEHYGGILPERVSIAWGGYLAGLLEWGLLSVPAHHQVANMLPNVDDHPVYAIMLGRDGPDGPPL